MKSKLVDHAVRIVLFCLVSIPFAPNAWAQTNGIFADFATSMGNFTCRLEYTLAAQTVANFIGLATGEQAWLDEVTGIVRSDPFYDGLIFHRVIAGFMDQSGSPGGQPSGNPGYNFRDEFDPGLRHDAFGMLSMANSGADSSGSQFFITVASRPDLDDRYTIFGKVVTGSNVVYAINHVATDANDRPLTNVVVNSVVIRRVGVEAQAFDIHAQGLPLVRSVKSEISKDGGNLSLTWSNSLNMDNRLYASSNLEVWNESELGIETSEPILRGLFLTKTFPQRFYKVVQIRYPDTLLVPKQVVNRTIILSFSNVFGTIAILPDSAGGGIYSQNGGTIGEISYNWVQDAYRGRLAPILYSGVMPMKLDLDFASATNGNFSGTAFPNYPSSMGSGPVSGTFTASP